MNFSDLVFKGRELPIGTKRKHGNVMKVKTPKGWVPVKEAKESKGNFFEKLFKRIKSAATSVFTSEDRSFISKMTDVAQLRSMKEALEKQIGPSEKKEKKKPAAKKETKPSEKKEKKEPKPKKGISPRQMLAAINRRLDRIDPNPGEAKLVESMADVKKLKGPFKVTRVGSENLNFTDGSGQEYRLKDSMAGEGVLEAAGKLVGMEKVKGEWKKIEGKKDAPKAQEFKAGDYVRPKAALLSTKPHLRRVLKQNGGEFKVFATKGEEVRVQYDPLKYGPPKYMGFDPDDLEIVPKKDAPKAEKKGGMTAEERKRLDVLQDKEDKQELTGAEQKTYTALVEKYRETDEYKDAQKKTDGLGAKLGKKGEALIAKVRATKNKFEPKVTEVDWGSGRGQGRRSGKQVRGAMSDMRGKKKYSDPLANVPGLSKVDEGILKRAGKEAINLFLQGVSAGLSNNDASILAMAKYPIAHNLSPNEHEKAKEIVEDISLEPKPKTELDKRRFAEAVEGIERKELKEYKERIANARDFNENPFKDDADEEKYKKLVEKYESKDKKFDPKNERSFATTFDGLKTGQIIQASFRGVMGGNRKGEFKVGRRSVSKKYRSEAITLIPMKDGKEIKTGPFGRYRIRKERSFADGSTFITGSIGDMGIELEELGRPKDFGQAQQTKAQSAYEAQYKKYLDGKGRFPSRRGLSNEQLEEIKTRVDAARKKQDKAKKSLSSTSPFSSIVKSFR